MCYSKEVSLAVGSVMLLASAYTYTKYVKPILPEPPPAVPPRSAKGPTPLFLQPAFRSMVLAHACIGLHQLLEFGAIATGSQVLYKLGLVLSMSCMFFLIRSLEQLTWRSFGAPVVALLIFVISVDLFRRPMAFENAHFWVRGHDHALWGQAWMAMFMYWNVCIFSARRSTYGPGDGGILRIYGWGMLNLTFLFSMTYTFLAGLKGQVGLSTWFGNCIGAGEITEGYEIVKDTPSIWCVFAAVQVLFVPYVMRKMRAGYVNNQPPEPQIRPLFTRMILVVAGVLLTVLLYSAFPIVRAVAEKMITH